MGDREQPDVGAALTIARDNLRRLRPALADLHPLVYDSDWRPESGRSTRNDDRIPWSGAESLQAAYLRIVKHLADAHWALGRNTDVEDLWLVPWADPRENDWRPLELRVPTVSAQQADGMAAMLSDALGRLQDTFSDLRPPELSAAAEAADHVAGAMALIPDGFGDRTHDVEGRRCRNFPDCHRLAEPDRKECATCRAQRRRVA